MEEQAVAHADGHRNTKVRRALAAIGAWFVLPSSCSSLTCSGLSLKALAADAGSCFRSFQRDFAKTALERHADPGPNIPSL